jgi:ribosomal protein S18 acetylase RimI-like enzyme
MNIRDAAIADLDAVAPLCCLVNQLHVAAHPAIYKRLSIEAARNLLAPRIDDPDYVLRLAEDGANVLGYYCAEIRATLETELVKAYRLFYLAEIMVAPDAQGTGVGRTLVADLRHIAASRKVDRVELDVSAYNAKARAFFEGQGFDRLRTRMRMNARSIVPNAWDNFPKHL